MKRFAQCLLLSTTLLSFLLNPVQSNAEDLKVKVGAYVDTYISTDNEFFDISKRTGRNFSVVSNTKNEFALNVAQVSANIDYQGFIRSTFVLQTGTLPQFAYGSAGPNLQQANVGVRIVDGLWLDAGYFATHIGAESYLPKDNWLSSHSMVTYYEPFFQNGVRLTYDFSSFTAQLHVINQNGVFDDNNQNKTYGLYFKYNGGDMLQASYAGCYGNEEPSGSLPKTHMLHNIVLESHPIKDLGIKAHFDMATKEKSAKDDAGKDIDGSFMGFSLQAKYNILSALSATARFAYTDNTETVYPSASALGGLKGTDITVGCEYKPSPSSYIRFEYRMLNFDEGKNKEGNVFIDADKKPINTRNDMMINFGVWLD
jgi:hypothetical protein